MKTEFDFDQMVNRRGSSCAKWDSSDDAGMLPMWVADMDFRTAPAIIEAVQKRAAEGVFGYVRVPNSYYEAVIDWFSRRHGWQIGDPGDIIYIPGIVPALCILVDALTNPGDGIIFQTPAYNAFFPVVEENGRRVVPNPLLRREVEGGFTFELDFEGLERLCADPANTLLLLCNPHNPTGRVWTSVELQRVCEICRRHGVTVVADEIHCEIVHPGFRHTPFATIEPDCVTCCSPTKGFNIAGLLISNIVTRRADLREKINRRIRATESNLMNPFGVVALEAAYRHGAGWLDALNTYLFENYRVFRSELESRLPQVKVCCSEATYLSWLDVSALGIDGDEAEERCKREHVWINSGRMYGDSRYVRVNLACPRPLLMEGIDRICKALGSK